MWFNKVHEMHVLKESLLSSLISVTINDINRMKAMQKVSSEFLDKCSGKSLYSSWRSINKVGQFVPPVDVSWWKLAELRKSICSLILWFFVFVVLLFIFFWIIIIWFTSRKMGFTDTNLVLVITFPDTC